MTLFLMLAAAMLLAALAFVIVPLVRTIPQRVHGHENLVVLADGQRELDAERAAGRLSEDEHASALRELEVQALQAHGAAAERHSGEVRAGWSAALAVGIALPLAATVLYIALGRPVTLATDVSSAAAAHAQGGQARTDGAIDALARRLEQAPGDGEGWVLLARSYLAANRVADAIGAYRKASALLTDNADLLVEYANTIGLANNRHLVGQPEELVKKALAIDPDNFNALALAGAAALQAGDRARALAHWTRLESLLEAGSEDHRRIGALIARAKGEPVPASASANAAMAPAAAAAAAPVAQTADATPHGAAGTAAEIRGTVTIAGELASKVAPTDTLYIFARAADGPPMPLAAVRTRAGAWPVSFKLDDSSAMAEGMALSRFPKVNIVARVSRLGSPTAQPGDIEGRIENVALGSSEVRVVMDRVVGR